MVPPSRTGPSALKYVAIMCFVRYAVAKGAFSTEKVGQFLISLGTGAAGIRPLPSGGLAAVQDVEPWDGEDAPEEDEEFSLEDIMGSDF